MLTASMTESRWGVDSPRGGEGENLGGDRDTEQESGQVVEELTRAVWRFLAHRYGIAPGRT